MKKKNIILLCIVVIGLAIFTIFVIINSEDYYKIEDRKDKLEEYYEPYSKPLGWLRIQGTDIDFAIFYSGAISLQDGKYEFGWINRNDNDLDRTVILSHNVLNVSNKPLITNKYHKRFEQLAGFLYYDFANKNKYVQYTTNKGNFLYKIYAVSIQKYPDQYDSKMNTSKKKKYINSTIKKSYFDYDVDVNEKDKLLTLITCTRFYGDTTDYSIVVDARKLRKNEKPTNYSVLKKKGYLKIEKIIKGDVSNE